MILPTQRLHQSNLTWAAKTSYLESAPLNLDAKTSERIRDICSMVLECLLKCKAIWFAVEDCCSFQCTRIIGELRKLGIKNISPFDIDERVALNGNCDFPIAGESHSLLLTVGRPCSFSVSINMHDNWPFRATSENKSSSQLPKVWGSGHDRVLEFEVEWRSPDF